MVGILVGWPGWGHRTICSKLHAKPNIQSNQARFTNERTLLAKSPGLPRRATMGCDNPPLPKRSCSFVAVSAMNEHAIDYANSSRNVCDTSGGGLSPRLYGHDTWDTFPPTRLKPSPAWNVR